MVKLSSNGRLHGCFTFLWLSRSTNHVCKSEVMLPTEKEVNWHRSWSPRRSVSDKCRDLWTRAACPWQTVRQQRNWEGDRNKLLICVISLPCPSPNITSCFFRVEIWARPKKATCKSCWSFLEDLSQGPEDVQRSASEDAAWGFHRDMISYTLLAHSQQEIDNFRMQTQIYFLRRGCAKRRLTHLWVVWISSQLVGFKTSPFSSFSYHLFVFYYVYLHLII